MSTWPGEESAQYQTGPSEQAQAQPLPVPQGYQQPV